MSQTLAMKDGDWVIEANGQPKMIEGFSKVGQDVIHALQHPYDARQDYGNEMFSYGVLVIERAAVPGLVRREVTAAISRLRATQRKLPTGQLPNTERITGVKQVVVDTDSFTLGVSYMVRVAVAERQLSEVRKAFVITNRHLYPDKER